MKKYVYVLRTCNSDMTSHRGFLWKKKGKVSCPDFVDSKKCGNGLHGLLLGAGDGALLNWNPDANWLACKVLESDIIDLNRKVKFKECTVVHCGDRLSATNFIIKKGADASKVVGATLTGGDYATLTGGDHATLTGGDYATLTGGDRATLTGGDDSTLTGGDYATLTGGYDSTLTGGDHATLTGGDDSTLTGGDRATLTGGDHATLTGGDRATLTGGDYATLTGGNFATLTGGDCATLTGGYDSTLTGGDYATLTGGYDSTLTGGNFATLTGGDRATLTGGYDSTLIFKYVDKNSSKGIKTAAVGEDGIKSGVAYKCKNGEIVEVKK